MRKIIVYCELQNDEPSKISLELISKARELATDDGTVIALIVGRPENPQFKRISTAGADKIIVLNEPIFEQYCPTTFAEGIFRVAENEKPDVMLFGATCEGRELAPCVTTLSGVGLTADCTGLRFSDDGMLEATRPAFSGNVYATIVYDAKPYCATVRRGVFAEKYFDRKTTVVYKNVFIETPRNTEILNNIPEYGSGDEIENAKILVAGGAGVKNYNGFELLKDLAHEAGASVCASRAATEKGLADESLRVGQTGKTVNANFYLACGISGAAQHIAGITSCGTIAAINTDKDAPIFEYSDFGYVGDFAQIIPLIVQKLRIQKEKEI